MRSVSRFTCGVWAAWVLAGAGLAGDANPPAAPKDVKEVEFRMSPTNLVSLPLAQFTAAPGMALPGPEGKIALGPEGFPYKIDKLGIQVNTQGIWKAVTKSGQQTSLSWKDGNSERRVTIALEQDKDKNWRATPVTALVGAVGTTRIAILDWNFNAAYNDEGADAVVIGDNLYAIPLEKVLYVDKFKATLNLTPTGAGSRIAVEPLPDSPVMPALLHLNMRRLDAGLPPRPLDEMLCDACQKHAHYCVINKYFGHPEEKGKPGYTKEGHELGGMNSIMSSGKSSVGAVDGFLCTFLHRIDEIHPDTDGFGIGNEGAVTSINGRTKRRSLKWTYPVLYPAPEMNDVPTRFENESPNPLPGEHGNKPAGFPVTATFPGGCKVTEATGEMVAIGPTPPPPGSDPDSWPKGTRVDCYFSTPEKPAALGNLNSICFIGKTLLSSNTVHVVRISYNAGGTKDSRVWWFKTGASAGFTSGPGRRGK